MGNIIQFQSKADIERKKFISSVELLISKELGINKTDLVMTESELDEMVQENLHPALKLYQLHYQLFSKQH